MKLFGTRGRGQTPSPPPPPTSELLQFRNTMIELLRARFPYLYIQTVEEERALEELRALLADPRLARHTSRISTWSLTHGLLHDGSEVKPGTQELGRALDEIERYDGPAIFVLFDMPWYFRANRRVEEQRYVRRLRDLRPCLTSGTARKTIVFIAPELVLPTELEQEVYVVDFPLPGPTELREVLEGIIDENKDRLEVDLDEPGRERLVHAALGLTVQEAENAFARGAVHDGRLDAHDVDLVMEEKRQAIRKTSLLEYVTHAGGFEDIGGLDQLKEWLGQRDGAWTTSAREFGLPFPRGVLITGVPGCGKSLTARCTSAMWKLPLLRLDVGRIFAGIVGSSEQNMRSAIRTAEALAPCVLWIDEVEKGFGGSRRQDLDSGTSARVFGTFLTWMQEKRQPVFVIATANDIMALPPEFLRKGRFDEIFFVDLPTTGERVDIFRIHLTRYLASPRARGDFPMDERAYAHLAELAEEFSGAEIEQAVVAAMFAAFAERRSIRVDDVAHAIKATVALSRTQAEQIQAARAWANQRAVAATRASELADFLASSGSQSGIVRGGRTLDM